MTIGEIVEIEVIAFAAWTELKAVQLDIAVNESFLVVILDHLQHVYTQLADSFKGKFAIVVDEFSFKGVSQLLEDDQSHSLVLLFACPWLMDEYQ